MLKRIFDLLLSILLIIVTLPIMILVIYLIKRDSPGPAIYIQERQGQNGKTFKAYKFRTMYDGSSIGNLNAPDKNDKRVTKIGKLLRKTSIDELPQLFNVLKNDMSIVGPRAVPHKEILLRLDKLNKENPDDVELHQHYMNLRQKVKPGITGMAQAYGRSSLSTLEATKLDVYYAENTSLLLDIKVILKTAQTVLFQRGVN
ncbi:sugar transferase [Halalkalibacterium halodurans]|uniref:sugar transferase n=1 Tax=Halalkalibacterium halodurans TaxID=86665 RepID=UPI002E226B55|nr:sugar transferase [Halalkalibacterium halodurans]